MPSPEGVWVDLTPADQVARGLLKPGPLTPAITSKNPEVNAKAIREFVNPAVTPINPLQVLGKLHSAAGAGLGHVAGALGGLNLGGAMMSPEQKALRSRQIGNQFRDIGEMALLPVASAGRVIGPLAQQARPMFTAFLTRLAQQGGVAGIQQAMQGGDPGTVFGHAAAGMAFQGAMETPAKLVRTIMASKAGQRILASAAASFKETLGSFQARQQFDKEFVDQLNELRAQGMKEQAAQASAAYGRLAFEHKVAGQKMTADWEKQVAAQEAVKEAARVTHMDKVAERLAVDWDARVPAWKGMPQTVEGLVDRVYGQGQAKLSAAFDTSLKEIVERAQGKMLSMPAADATALGLAEPKAQQALFEKDALLQKLFGGTPGPGMAPGASAPEGMVQVDASKVAQAVLGKKGQIDPDLYHSVADLLTRNGLGNAAANAEYASGMALKKFVDKTQALEFIDQPTLYPERLLAGLTKEMQLKQLQGRISGEDALRGSVAAAREGLPAELPAIPKPRQGPLAPKPPEPVAPLDVKYDPQLAKANEPTMPTPEELGVTLSPPPTPWKMASLGGGLGGALLGALGGGYGHYGVGGSLGTLAGLYLSHKLPAQIPSGPLSPTADAILAKAPTIAAGILRAIAGGGEVSPADLAEIRAAQAAGQTAADNPALQLQVEPQ